MIDYAEFARQLVERINNISNPNMSRIILVETGHNLVTIEAWRGILHPVLTLTLAPVEITRRRVLSHYEYIIEQLNAQEGDLKLHDETGYLIHLAATRRLNGLAPNTYVTTIKPEMFSDYPMWLELKNGGQSQRFALTRYTTVDRETFAVVPEPGQLFMTTWRPLTISLSEYLTGLDKDTLYHLFAIASEYRGVRPQTKHGEIMTLLALAKQAREK